MTDRVEQAMSGGAAEVARAVARGEVSASEVVRAALERIERGNARIGAVVELRAADAIEEAAQLDREGPVGPLSGVPITIKEALHVEGMRSTWGLSSAAEHVASSDAIVVARLREGGAIVVGTTNAHEMLADFGQTTNAMYGRTSNPWDTSRAAGGSSGGSAAAVAAGLSCLDIGSDLVGSVRFPAAFCGVCGLRPSEGVVPLEGFRPPGAPQIPDEAAYLTTLGPIARTVEDLRIALELIATTALTPARHDRLEDFRVGVVLDDATVPTSHESLGILHGMVAQLEAAGVAIVHGWPDGIDPGRDFETFGRHLDAFFAATDPNASGDDAVTLRDAPDRKHARDAWARHFDDVDVFVCPVASTTAYVHDDRPFADRTVATTNGEIPYSRLPFWISHATLSGLPAATVPVGTAPDGLPVGVQLMGAHREDPTVLAFADRLTTLISAR
ncbi:MAG: amidase family protein [Solirubrobacteraceae bacterium]